MEYFKDDFATVEYDSETTAVISHMQDYAEGEDFRKYMDSIIDAIEDTGTDRMIADTSNIPPLSQEDQAWSVEDWGPRAEDAGLEHMALVMPESVVAEMTLDSIMEMVDDSINRELFDSVGEAREWVKAQ